MIQVNIVHQMVAKLIRCSINKPKINKWIQINTGGKIKYNKNKAKLYKVDEKCFVHLLQKIVCVYLYRLYIYVNSKKFYLKCISMTHFSNISYKQSWIYIYLFVQHKFIHVDRPT